MVAGSILVLAGVILFTQTNSDGSTTTTQERFCMGCGVDTLAGGDGGGGNTSGDCESGIGTCTPTADIAKNMKRTYWYRK